MKTIKLFEEFKTFSQGVQFFVPENAAGYAAGKPCKGFGSVRYGEGSLYCGDLYFDGKNYNKLGFGRQDFMLSELGSLNPAKNIRKAFYIGSFDYRETDWIYGDGVMYYVDANNHPACFVKGCFSGVNKIGEYGGEFSVNMLADGFTPDMERDFDEWHEVLERMCLHKSNLKTLKNLFIGDSYFEFWCNTEFSGTGFYDSFDSTQNLNIGVGGTRFCDWLRFLNDLTELPAPERIIINLGFNDIHSNYTADKVYKDCEIMLGVLKSRYPKADYRILNVVKAPAMEHYYSEEEKLNKTVKNSADKLGVKVIDMRSAIASADGVFHADGVHLNPRGYEILTRKIKEVLNA